MTRELEDALDGMDARRLERLRAAIDRRLAACVIDPHHTGAVRVAIRWGSTSASMMICPACLERHRLPELRVPSEVTRPTPKIEASGS